jgi:TonB family protein
MSEVWRRWEGEVINRVFPLLRFLNDSDHSAVFLTESKSHKYAAIKLVEADRARTQTQLSRWRRAIALPHPHLIRLIDSGQCQLGVGQFLFVVMEYADETLAQILPRRALTPEEVREMLLPTLDALVFLHRKKLVQGALKPPNLLVVNDRLKLASDAIRPAGESTASIAALSVYDPPEAKDGRFSTAGDIWGLGITLVEALTQHVPEWADEQPETACLPTTLPAIFPYVVQRCLSHNPAVRPTATELEALLKRGPQAPVVSVPESPKQRSRVPAIAAVLTAAVLIVVVAVWGGARLFQSHPSSRHAASNTFQASAQPPAQPLAASPVVAPPAAAGPDDARPPAALQNPQPPASPPEVPAPSSSADRPAPAPAETPPSVLHEEIPDVPRSARDTIHGHVRVAVRVSVDASGNVLEETLDNPGPSKYFARLATEAARKWSFAPAANQDSREWLLRFEFTRAGTTAHASLRNQH